MEPIAEKESRPRFSLRAFFLFVATLPERAARALAASPVGHFFHGYKKTDALLRESRSFTAVHDKWQAANSHPRKKKLVTAFADSPVLSVPKAAGEVLQHTETRVWGILFGTFGVYNILVYVIRYFLLSETSSSRSGLITGAVLAGLSLPLLFIARPLCEFTGDSRVLNWFLYRFIGLHRHADLRRRGHTINGTVAFLAGSVMGILSFFVHPLYILLGLFAFFAFFVLLSSPELCLFGALFCAPFGLFIGQMPVLIAVVTVLGLVSYAGKVLLGKRLFAAGPADLFVLLFGALYLLSAVFSAGGAGSGVPALLSAALVGVYFLAVNLLTSPALLRRAVHAWLFGAGAVGILCLVSVWWGDDITALAQNAFADAVYARVSAAFADPNIIAPYLALTIPLAAARMLGRRENPAGRFFSLLVFAIAMTGVVYAAARGTWVAVLGALILFLLACQAGTLWLSLPMAVGFTVFLSRRPSLGEATAGDVARGVWRIIGTYPIGGIGVGEEAFTAVYPYFAVTGAEGARHAHSLYLQLFAELGIAGPLFFFLAVLFLYQCVLTHQHTEHDPDLRLFSIAVGCAMAAGLLNGVTAYLFANLRMLFLFFLLAGMGVALYRVGQTEGARAVPIRDGDGSEANADIPIRRG